MFRFVLTMLCVAALMLPACSGPPGDDGASNQWKVGENQNDNSGEQCPGEDDGYFYFYEDPDQCHAVDIACDLDSQPFSDPDCGCGCRAAEPDCPDESQTFYSTECTDDGFPIGCPEEEGWTGEYIEGCGCYCEYDPPPVECPDEDDGYFYHSEEPDECDGVDISCGDGEEPFYDPDCGCGCRDISAASALCTAWDIEPEGACDMVLGVGFNGEECVHYSGCDCVGSDCGRLTSIENCQKMTGDCDNTCGDPDATGCGGDFDDLDPASCPDGSVYTVLDCEKEACVNPDTCEEVVVPD